MRRLFTASMTSAALLSTTLAACLLMPESAQAVSVTTTQLKLFADKPEASLNGQSIKLDEPATIVNDRFYVPAKWIADALSLSLEWDSKTNKIRLLAPRAYIELDAAHNLIKVNGSSISFDSVAEIRNGRLLIQLSWLAQYVDMPYSYKEEFRSVELQYVGQPYAPYTESLLHKDDAQPNSKPAAVFAFGKAAYRLGEPVEYIDLSYDPDAEGLPEYDWQGKQEVFFQPGEYTVTLQVADRHGNRSEPYSKTVTILDEPYLSQQEYPFYYKSPGTLVEAQAEWLKGLKTAGDAKLPVVVRQPEDRKLIIGSSAEPVSEIGFLYQDSFKQSARLSLQYANGRDKSVQYAVVLRNDNISKPVKVKTTRKAESQASIYTPVTAQKTAEQFLISQAAEDEISIEPGAAVFYSISPEAALGQGFHGIYDLEADGEVTVSYVMMEPGEALYNLGAYKTSAGTLKGNRSATYPVAEVGWEADARGLQTPVGLGIGDPTVEPPIKGMDATTKQEAAVQGLAGIRYSVKLQVDGKYALAIHPRSGFFQGAIRVDGNIIPVPAAGLTANDMLVVGRTPASGKLIDLELLAADGSAVPVDLVLVPLNKASN